LDAIGARGALPHDIPTGSMKDDSYNGTILFMRASVSPDGGSYSYAGTSYANPHAPTQIANGVSTTTYSYDNNGNLIQKTTDGTTTTYVYDYANRLTALGVLGATTTYGYDAFGARVLQTGTSTTFIYPSKFYSIASSTGSGAKFATTTSYVFNGDTLLATVDQQTASGVATGTAKTRYVHPDHLGSTNVVTDENANLVQTLDYYPYGGTRISAATSTNEARKFIGQFADTTGLDYFNARYYASDRGQFITEDPSFLSVGDPNQVKQVTGRDQQAFLGDPQLANSYNYGRDNPIAQKDANGLLAGEALVGAGIGGVVGLAVQGGTDLIAGRLSSAETYAGAFTGGATFGAILGATDGLSLLYTVGAGGVSGAVQSATTQGLSIADGSQKNFSYRDFGNNVILSAATAPIPGLRIAGVTADRGSFLAVQKQIYTKLSNQTLSPSNIRASTYAKMTVSTGAQQAPGAAVQGVLANLRAVLTEMSSFLSAMAPSTNSKQ
jgi:RHS repeat-associated protein